MTPTLDKINNIITFFLINNVLTTIRGIIFCKVANKTYIFIPIFIKIDTNHPCSGAPPNFSIIINITIVSLRGTVIFCSDRNKNNIDPHLWIKKYFSPISNEEDTIKHIIGKNDTIFSSIATHMVSEEFDLMLKIILTTSKNLNLIRGLKIIFK